MRSEFMPTVTLQVRPLVMAICKDMGIEGSELSEAIRDAVDYEIKKMMVELPKMVKNEVNNLFHEIVTEECNSYAAEWMSPKWVKDDPYMLKEFRSSIKTEVMIAIGKYIEENGKNITGRKTK